MRAHRLVLTAPLRRAPKDFGNGWWSYPMRNWVKWTSTWAVDDVSVVVQLTPKSIVLHMPETYDTPVRAVLEAFSIAEHIRRAFVAEGIEFGGLGFQVPPEYAYEDHPAAHEWLRRGHAGVALVEGRLWVDCSKGVPELETNDAVLAGRIERLPYAGAASFDVWLADLLHPANASP